MLLIGLIGLINYAQMTILAIQKHMHEETTVNKTRLIKIDGQKMLSKLLLQLTSHLLSYSKWQWQIC